VTTVEEIESVVGSVLLTAVLFVVCVATVVPR